jgi:RHS repeat-associated protein
LSTAFGAGDLGQNIPDPFMKSSVSTFAHQSSDFPEMTTLTEGPSAVTQPRSYQQTLNYDTPGDVTKVDVNGLSFEQHFDEAGNVVRTKEPSQDPNVDLTTTYQYDGRGKVATETKPGSPNNPVKYEWSSTGVAAKYTDEQGEKTTSASTDRDLLGRPLRRVYQDGTTEQFVWDGPRLRSYTNRSGQLQTFEYYPNTDRLFRITYGSTVEILTYDDAGRLKTWTTPGAILTYSNYDKEGHPGQTAVTRIAPDGATQLATYTQTHTWNAHGERMAWTMPRSTAPTVPWTDTVNEDHDEAGNVIGITRTLFGSTSSVPSSVLAAQFLNAGRPFQRTITTDCSAISACNAASIVRNYDYNSVGQMSRVEVQSAGQTVAGSQVAFDGVRISDIQILGISGDTHHSKFHYDARGRLDGMIPDTTDANANATSASVPGRIGLSYDDTDFLSQKARTPLDPSAAVVQSTFTPTSAGHKVQSLGSQTFTYGGNPTTGAGANLVDDGKYVYEWDAKDELIAVIQKPLTTASPIRRIRYFYDGNGRIVGRRAESANVTTLSDPLDALQWQLETNPSILAGDGLPADTTFVWDPISDQLVSVFDTNASPTDPNGGLLRQYLHGGIGYDDPIEVTVNFSQTAQGGLQRLYPVFDEAGTGSLQAVLNAGGQMVARNLPQDPAGSDDVDFAGAAIDHVAIGATKDSNNNLQTVTVTVHATEPLNTSTFNGGFRLATFDGNGSLVRTSSATAQAVSGDPNSARITLSASDWTALTAPNAASLSIAVSKTLRAQLWGGLPILPPASGQSGIMSSPDYPVELRDLLTSVTAFLANVASGSTDSTTIFDVPSIAIAGSAGVESDPAAALFTARFQALPFADPATGLIYARARWYNPETQTFISPDPMGYKDSSTLYAFGGGDPVNGRDPDGTRKANARERAIIARLKARGGALYRQWSRDQRATGYTYRPHVEEGLYRHAYQAPVRLQPQPFEISTQAQYETERAYLVADLKAFEDAIDDASEREVVDYVPLRVQQMESGEAWHAGLVDLPDEIGGVLAGPAGALEAREEPIPEIAAGWETGRSPGRTSIPELRSKTPDRAGRESVNPPGAKADPVYGYPVARYEADHVVSFNEILQMPGFLDLTKTEQLEILNMPVNMMGLGKRTNASKQDASWAEWPGHSELGPVSPAFRAAMIAKAAQVKRALQRAIDQRLVQ